MLTFAFGLMLATLSSSELLGERRVERRLRARYLAESGLALAYADLNGGQGAFALDRTLFDGELRVHAHAVPGAPGLVDLLSQGVVDGAAVMLYARCERDAPLVSTGAPPTGNGGSSPPGGGILVHFQLAVPLALTGGGAADAVHPSDGAFMAKVRDDFDARRQEARRLWTEQLAPLGRRRIHALCRQAVDRLLDGDGEETAP